MPMQSLDKIVMAHIEANILPPDRLEDMLKDYIASARDREAATKAALTLKRTQLTETKAAITRLLGNWLKRAWPIWEAPRIPRTHGCLAVPPRRTEH